MPRYIDADLLKTDYFALPSTSGTTVSTQYVSLFQILNTPTADVRENVHAHWNKVEMKKGEWWHTCSKCKATWGSEDGEFDFNYCPNCGAEMTEMRGEQN